MQKSPLFQSGDIIQQMPNVINWLTELGISNANNSRYSRYVDYIKRFYSSDMSGVTNENFKNVSKSHSECLDIVIIYKTFKNERSKGFFDRLSKAVSGTDFYNSSPNESRNFLFELVISAKFKSCGYSVDFNHLTDIIAYKNGFTVYGECKRLSSLNKFEDNFKKAGKQLQKKALTDSDYHYGIIFLDISNLILESFPIEPFKSTDTAQQFVTSVVNGFKRTNMRKINNLNSRFVDCSLGACLLGKNYICTDPIGFYSVKEFSIVTKPDLNDHLFKVLHILFRGFESAFHNFLSNENEILYV